MSTVQNAHRPPQSFLDTHRQDDLDALFDSLESAAELDGTYVGRLIGISGLSWLPGMAKWFTYGILGTWLNPWRGKRFAGDHGANLWGVGRYVAGWGHYRLIDSKQEAVTKLDYNVKKNPSLLRPILGEVRQIQDGLFLARMRYRTRSGVKTLMYFTLRSVAQ